MASEDEYWGQAYRLLGQFLLAKHHRHGAGLCEQVLGLVHHVGHDNVVLQWHGPGLREETNRQPDSDTVAQCTTALACYRKLHQPCSNDGQLILPECMR